MANDLWVEIGLESEEMEKRIQHAITSCYLTHVWGMRWLKERWLQKMEVMQSSELMPKILLLLKENGYGRGVQRYALKRALQKTIDEFTQSLQFVKAEIEEESKKNQSDVYKIALPRDIPQHAFVEMDIQKRKIWRKRIEEEGKITTAYGDVYLQGNWQDALRQQAEILGIQTHLVPFLWEGVTLREPTSKEGWHMRFNFNSEIVEGKEERTEKRKWQETGLMQNLSTEKASTR